MGKKEKYIHIRSDEQLKAALADSAKRHLRKETDEARYLLMLSLGMVREDSAPYLLRTVDEPKKKTPGHG